MCLCTSFVPCFLCFKRLYMCLFVFGLGRVGGGMNAHTMYRIYVSVWVVQLKMCSCTYIYFTTNLPNICLVVAAKALNRRPLNTPYCQYAHKYTDPLEESHTSCIMEARGTEGESDCYSNRVPGTHRIYTLSTMR